MWRLAMLGSGPSSTDFPVVRAGNKDFCWAQMSENVSPNHGSQLSWLRKKISNLELQVQDRILTFASAHYPRARYKVKSSLAQTESTTMVAVIGVGN